MVHGDGRDTPTRSRPLRAFTLRSLGYRFRTTALHQQYDATSCQLCHQWTNPVYNDNPPNTRLLIGVNALMSGFLLVAGFGMLFFLSIIGPEWPWDISKFNALLLGAGYTGALVAAIITVYVGRWAPARVVMPMILIFAVVLLVVSLTELNRFDLGDYSTWLWFSLYVVIPANAVYQIWLSRHLKPYYPYPLRAPWRSILLAPVVLLGAYGLGLLLAPGTFSSFWPWPIDDFHARAYSVLFLCPGLAAILMWRAAAAIELLTAGLALAVGGAIPLVGIWSLDRDLNSKYSSSGGTWLWLGTFAVLLLAGLGLVWQSRTQEYAESSAVGADND